MTGIPQRVVYLFAGFVVFFAGNSSAVGVNPPDDAAVIDALPALAVLQDFGLFERGREADDSRAHVRLDANGEVALRGRGRWSAPLAGRRALFEESGKLRSHGRVWRLRLDVVPEGLGGDF